MTYKRLNTSYALTLNLSSLLIYIVEIYGKEIYLNPQQLMGILSDLSSLDSNYLKLYRRAIMEENISREIYNIVEYNESDCILIQKLEVQFRESNFLSEYAAKSVISNLFYAISGISIINIGKKEKTPIWLKILLIILIFLQIISVILYIFQ